jgi:hypothetical protein
VWEREPELKHEHEHGGECQPQRKREHHSDGLAQPGVAKAKQNKETIGDSLDDAWIHTKVVAKLIGDTKTPERKINVDVVKNVVTLRGTVDTPEAKAEAERVAKDTDGVTKVVNQLKVVPASKTSNTNSNMNKSAKNKKAHEWSFVGPRGPRGALVGSVLIRWDSC